jgi:hypothetical protein
MFFGLPWIRLEPANICKEMSVGSPPMLFWVRHVKFASRQLFDPYPAKWLAPERRPQEIAIVAVDPKLG